MSIFSKFKYIKPSFWKRMAVEGKLVWRLVKDRRIPIYLKALPLFGAAYVVFPDLFTGIPFDDITVMMVMSALFLKFAPNDLINEHRLTLDNNSNKA